MPHILFLHNDPLEILPVVPFIKHTGAKVSMAQTPAEASLMLSKKNNIDTVIVDSELVHDKASSLFALKNSNRLRFFILSKDVDLVAIKKFSELGAQDFFVKPLTIDHIKKILLTKNTSQNILADTHCHFSNLVGNSQPMKKLYHFVERVAKTSASVFLIGESGTGKELVAQAIHQHSVRADKSFIAINCGAISSELIESALFGHEKGSFTGAIRAHVGYFEQASGGTLFLDEITETPQSFQIKLLRVLETGLITPVGSKQEIKVDVRIIASTNRCPELAVQEGLLRKDLYHRLNVFPIYTPPLNNRKEDIELLANYFLALLNEQEHTNIEFTPRALDALQKIYYSGNVRELKNMIHRAYILTDDFIDIGNICFPADHMRQSQEVFIATIGMSLHQLESDFIHFTLKHYNNNLEKAAVRLGIAQEELQTKLNTFSKPSRWDSE